MRKTGKDLLHLQQLLISDNAKSDNHISDKDIIESVYVPDSRSE